MKTFSRGGRIVAAFIFGSFLSSQAFAASSGSGALDILRSGLLGAGTGVISAGMSGGKAGKGALIGAGTNVIGGALLDVLTSPSSSQPVYYSQAPVTAAGNAYLSRTSSSAPVKHIIRKYDAAGKVVSEEEFWQ